MELTVLGRSSAFPNPGGACPSHLIRHEDTTLVLDCGSGCVSRLRQVTDYHKVSAVLITHMHWDHCSDILTYSYGMGEKARNLPKTKLYLPQGGEHFLDMCTFHEYHIHSVVLPKAFELHKIEARKTYNFGPLMVRFVPVRHLEPAYGIQITDGVKKFAYSGDAAPCEELVELAADADLFLCEAAVTSHKLFHSVGAEFVTSIHLAPRDIGDIAAEAGAKRILCTHVVTEFGIDQISAEVFKAFGGQVEVAEELRTYSI